MIGRSTTTPLSHIDALFIDLDGVVYAGPHAIPGAVAALERARQQLPVGYLTNNASRSDEQVAAHLRELGLTAAANDVVTSPQAALRILRERLQPGAAILVVGGSGITVELERAGYRLVSSADQAPAAVVQGFSPDLGWKDLAEAAFALRGTEVLWVATNMDWTIPVERGIAPGNGTLVSAVHTAVGRMPDAVAGKPEAALFAVARERFAAERPLMIGDRLDTDIAGANRAGIDAALVLTGIDRAKALLAAKPEERPRFILANLDELFEPYPEPVEKRGSWQSGNAKVRIDGRRVIVESDGSSSVELIRAACAAVWASGQAIYAFELDETLTALASL